MNQPVLVDEERLWIAIALTVANYDVQQVCFRVLVPKDLLVLREGVRRIAEAVKAVAINEKKTGHDRGDYFQSTKRSVLVELRKKYEFRQATRDFYSKVLARYFANGGKISAQNRREAGYLLPGIKAVLRMAQSNI